ncbi:Bifunctional pinoresinol-lariciresinol reductase [Sesamum angolense]|uniref:(+)-lariciresinol reductase n=1 Tax=Sesamum angolense TaxID=2727404 RepID=A0AAE1W9I4_9LAMI|nr:Bifunctional pinoresinol-lariciresinol reductase [Sesamum angolense]
MGKSKVLIIGGTGYLGKRLVKASLGQCHQTYVLSRPEVGLDIDKVEMLVSFKMLGAHLVPGSFTDYASLVQAVKLVDVVVCAISGVHMRSHSILLQLTLVQAIKEAGNVKRFLPSEFGTDPARSAKATEPGKVTFETKWCLVKSFLPQTRWSYMEMATLKVNMGEADWEGAPQNYHLQARFLASMKSLDYAQQVGLCHYHDVLYEGCLTNFAIGEDGEEASSLYPEVKYTTVEEFLKRYV